MNKKIYALAIAIVMILPLCAATQRVQAQGTTLSLQSTYAYNYFYNTGATISINLTVQDVSSLWSWDVEGLTWNNSMLQLTSTPSNVTEGPFLQNAGPTLFMETPPKPGNIRELSSTLLENTTASGSGNLAYINFTVVALGGFTTITLKNTYMLNNGPADISYTATNSLTIALRLMGDVVGNNKVDGRDITLIAIHFGHAVTPSTTYLDLGHYGKIDGRDITLAARMFGRHWP
jgi:hypothetical protein